ncbi:MAG: DsbA family protein [Pleurocapsa sp. SU_196_0]|nr:DsbA family protein [Pleurocapsa sp. SU_196_0]
MVTVYFDFLCPYAWRGLELLAALEIEFDPVHYSLVQGNHPENAGLLRSAPLWKLVDQPLLEGTDNLNQSLEAFLASHAAAKQGKALHERFILQLFRAKHMDKQALSAEITLEAATRAGLNLEQFKADRAEGKRCDARNFALDLERAAGLGVFGTPTIQLETGEAAYYRFAHLPETPEARLGAWNLFQTVLRDGATIETIKRPRAGSKA